MHTDKKKFSFKKDKYKSVRGTHSRLVNLHCRICGTLFAIYQKDGPEFFRDGSSKSFISKNLKNTELIWIGSNRKINSLEKRKHTDAVNFMTEFLKKNLQTGMPKGLQSDFKRGFEVSIGNKNLSKSIKEAAGELISTDGTFLHFN